MRDSGTHGEARLILADQAGSLIKNSLCQCLKNLKKTWQHWATKQNKTRFRQDYPH